MGLTLGDLIGVLNEFFSRLGLKKLRFKPAFNPYTEPSMEIFRRALPARHPLPRSPPCSPLLKARRTERAVLLTFCMAPGCGGAHLQETAV